MIEVHMNEGGHQWEKTNLTTLGGGNGRSTYDTYRCTACGLTGKMYHFNHITIQERSRKKLFSCPGLKKARKIRITCCRAVGSQFANLTPDSVHEVIPTPPGNNSNNGVWVMGVGEPVKVLNGEFTYINE